MSDEIRNHAEILMELRDPRSLRQDDTSDAISESEASGSYAARFAELLSTFMPEDEPTTELAHL
jgi:hypothetical protein